MGLYADIELAITNVEGEISKNQAKLLELLQLRKTVHWLEARADSLGGVPSPLTKFSKDELDAVHDSLSDCEDKFNELIGGGIADRHPVVKSKTKKLSGSSRGMTEKSIVGDVAE